MKALALVMLLSCSASAGQMSRDLPGLIALWHMNEGSGTTFYDAKGNYNATIQTGSWVSGKADKGAQTSASMAYTGNTTAISYITVMAWIKVSPSVRTQGTQGQILSQPVDNTGDTFPYHHMGLWVYDNVSETRAFVSLIVISGTRQFCTSDLVGHPINTINGWYHVAFTYDGVEMKNYINGRRLTSKSSCLFSGSISAKTTPYWIAGYRSGDVGEIRPYTGPFDEVAIFNRALSQGEIRRIYSEGEGRYAQ